MSDTSTLMLIMRPPILLWMRNTTHIFQSMTKVLCTLLNCMWIFLIAVVRSNIVSRHHVRNDTFTDKILNVNPTMTYTVVSLAECLSLCSLHDSCFGYHVSTSVCNVYKSCHQNDISADETGWMYYKEVMGE